MRLKNISIRFYICHIACDQSHGSSKKRGVVVEVEKHALATVVFSHRCRACFCLLQSMLLSWCLWVRHQAFSVPLGLSRSLSAYDIEAPVKCTISADRIVSRSCCSSISFIMKFEREVSHHTPTMCTWMVLIVQAVGVKIKLAAMDEIRESLDWPWKHSFMFLARMV